MPRTARIVVPGIAHHVTQRGNRRQQTFFEISDYARYVDLVAEGCRDAGVEVLSWCLMPNHVHLVLRPRTSDGLTQALSVAHQRYTWVVNRRKGWQGHLWHSRFYSCPLDDAHLRIAVRYVELNPLRARLVATPDAWRWSSANGRGDALVAPDRPIELRDIADWRAFLAQGIDDEAAERLRTHERKGLALGSDAFVTRVEDEIGRNLKRRPRGRPRLEAKASELAVSLPL